MEKEIKLVSEDVKIVEEELNQLIKDTTANLDENEPVLIADLEVKILSNLQDKQGFVGVGQLRFIDLSLAMAFNHMKIKNQQYQESKENKTEELKEDEKV